MEWIRQKIVSSEFLIKHRFSDKDFMRNRKLSFSTVMMLLIQKSMKSLQLKLNEFVTRFVASATTITASAFSQARLKLQPEAFKELSDGVLSFVYSDQSHKTFYGFEIIAVDASTLRLPDSETIRMNFPALVIQNQHQQDYYYAGQFIGLYDCLNRTALHAALNPDQTYEVKAFHNLLNSFDASFLTNPLYIQDRGYASYANMDFLMNACCHFVIRLPRQFLKETQFMFKDNAPQETMVFLKKSRASRDAKQAGIMIRLVRVILDNGEIEVLATNVSSAVIPAKAFKKLYHLRWGIETFFLILKDRLNLENFTGTSLIAVLQDVWATLFLSNLESLLTSDLNIQLQNKETKNSQRINQSVSFHTIKDKAFDLLLSQIPIETVLETLTKLFLMNPHHYRNNRNRSRTQRSARRALNHQKYKKKMVY